MRTHLFVRAGATTLAAWLLASPLTAQAEQTAPATAKVVDQSGGAMKDDLAQLASGRYTDVWARRGGKWLAVSAHVTRN